jgi:hypothetical protein
MASKICMFYSRGRPCPKGVHCQYVHVDPAHTSKERRYSANAMSPREPPLPNDDPICPVYAAGRRCLYGDKCTFVHIKGYPEGRRDSRAAEMETKTQSPNPYGAHPRSPSRERAAGSHSRYTSQRSYDEEDDRAQQAPRPSTSAGTTYPRSAMKKTGYEADRSAPTTPRHRNIEPTQIKAWCSTFHTFGKCELGNNCPNQHVFSTPGVSDCPQRENITANNF